MSHSTSEYRPPVIAHRMEDEVVRTKIASMPAESSSVPRLPVKPKARGVRILHRGHCSLPSQQRRPGGRCHLRSEPLAGMAGDVSDADFHHECPAERM
jgi:hypothetical protein